MPRQTEYAGFWIRLWASVVDAVLLWVIIIPAGLAIYGDAYFEQTSFMPVGAWDFLLGYVFPAVAVITFWATKGATPGKMLVHARIVDSTTGGPPTGGQLVGRYFAYILSMLPLLLGYIWVGIDAKKQGWHDKLAGTVVIREARAGKEPVRFEGHELSEAADPAPGATR
jgi:uncharacterized RDD family membrane protein YckC